MGRLVLDKIVMPYIGKERAIRIYLPKKYDSSNRGDCCEEMRFPVLYMHDGQNLFTNENAFGGCSWGAMDIMEKLEAEGKTDGIIIVGIDNDGERRYEDYSPWTNKEVSEYFNGEVRGGDGERYADFLVNVLKPYIDKTYRTKPQAEFTGVAGSSMGGFISIYIKLKYPHIFSKLGAFSSAAWFSPTSFDEFLKNAVCPKNQRYYIQVGTDERVGNNTPDIEQLFVDGSINIQKRLLQNGVDIDDIKLVIGVGDVHSEVSWNKHLEDFITFIFDGANSRKA